MQRFTVSSKRLVLALTLALTLAFGLLSGNVSVASAHRASQPGPDDAYPCQRTTWITLDSGSQGWFDQWLSSWSLDAKLMVLVDPDRGDSYCGAAQATATDSWYGSHGECVTFRGFVFEEPTYSQGSYFSVYHCTSTTYNLSGPVWYPACPPGSWLEEDNYTAEYASSIDSPRYNC